MWLKVGIPVLVLLSLAAVRVAYYLVWRRHWDRRPARRLKPARSDEVVVVIPDDAGGRSAAAGRREGH